MNLWYIEKVNDERFKNIKYQQTIYFNYGEFAKIYPNPSNSTDFIEATHG